MRVVTWTVLVMGAGFILACGQGSGSGGDPADSAVVDAAPVDAALDAAVVEVDATAAPVCLGTVYPTWGMIDPDDPVFSDGQHSQAQVTQMFADAKAADNQAYRGYRAARDHANVLDCAFCACGCANLVNHVSAIDCFKDMHGFT